MYTPLMIAAEIGDPKTLEILITDIECSGEPNIQDSLGYTPLMLATEQGNEEAVKELLASGADPYLKNINNKTVLELTNNENISEK